MHLPINTPVQLAITDSKGFHLTFDNGCTASVQFGYGNYCRTNQLRYGIIPKGGVASPNAEVAAWDATGSWIHPEGFDFDGDNALALLTPNEVLKFLQAVAEYPNAQTT